MPNTIFVNNFLNSMEKYHSDLVSFFCDSKKPVLDNVFFMNTRKKLVEKALLNESISAITVKSPIFKSFESSSSNFFCYPAMNQTGPYIKSKVFARVVNRNSEKVLKSVSPMAKTLKISIFRNKSTEKIRSEGKKKTGFEGLKRLASEFSIKKVNVREK